MVMFHGERCMVRNSSWSHASGQQRSILRLWVLPRGMCAGREAGASSARVLLGTAGSFQSQLCSLCWSCDVPEQFLEAVPVNEPKYVNYIKLSRAIGWVWNNHNRLGS